MTAHETLGVVLGFLATWAALGVIACGWLVGRSIFPGGKGGAR